jgi:hypothetical protein
MFLQIEKFLNPAELTSVAQIARQIKKASQIALGALQRSEEGRNFVFPRRVAALSFARYSRSIAERIAVFLGRSARTRGLENGVAESHAARICDREFASYVG